MAENKIETKIQEVALKLTPCGLCYSCSETEIKDCQWYKDIHSALTEIANRQKEIVVEEMIEYMKKNVNKYIINDTPRFGDFKAFVGGRFYEVMRSEILKQ